MDTATSAIHPQPAELDFRMLVENSLAGIYLVQGDRFRYVNRTLAAIFGYAPEVIVAEKTVSDLVAEEDRPRVRENVRRRESGEVTEVRYGFRGLRSDGTTVRVEVLGRATVVEGRPAVVGTLLDVTAHELEKERLGFLLRTSELLDRSLGYVETLERMAALMLPTLADCCLIDVVEGDQVERVAAGGAGEAGGDGRRVRRLSTDPREHPEVAVLRTGRSVLVPDVAREPGRVPADGAWRDCGVRHRDIRSYMLVPLISHGQIQGVLTLAATGGRRFGSGDLTFAQEVAHRAALAVENARLYREAQKAITAREEVLAVVSHDLRNPLNVIVMGSAMLMEKDRRSATPLEMIHRAAEQMKRLIEDLVDVSAIDAGGLSVAPEPRELAAVVERAMALHAPAAAGARVTLATEVPPGLPRVMVDEDRLVQALSNLVGNALKFTPPGGRVTVSARTGNGEARISVRDTGDGIPSAQLPHVFDRFWQARAGDGRGVGLGLSIVQGIARAHGGSVCVESEPGTGTTFHLTLPLAVEESTAAD